MQPRERQLSCCGHQGEGQQLASNQVQYSLAYRVPESNGVLEATRESGATLIAYSPLCQGLLTGRIATAVILQCLTAVLASLRLTAKRISWLRCRQVYCRQLAWWPQVSCHKR